MDPLRIAELLEPYLYAAPNHSEPAKADKACPEPVRKPARSLPKGESAILSPAQLQDISTYIDILVRWNSRINLTAIRDPEGIVTRHFGESIFAARHLFPRDAHVGTAALGCPAEQGSASTATAAAEACPELVEGQRQNAAHARPERSRRDAIRGSAAGTEQAPERRKLASNEEAVGLADDQRQSTHDRPTLTDVGSGAGFPGLPIRLWAPHISLTLIESNHKKATFLREVTRALTLTDVNIQTARAETLAGSLFSTVTLRAVERFAAILPTAAALLAPGGRLALLIGAAQQDQARSTLPHLTWSDPVPVPQSRSRILLVAHRSS